MGVLAGDGGLSVEEILKKVRDGLISVRDAEKQLRMFMVKDVEGIAKLDVARCLRRRVPEIVFAENKTPEETAKIAVAMAKQTGRTIVTRASEDHIRELKKLRKKFHVEVYGKVGTVVVGKPGSVVHKTGGRVAVLTAGTADIPVAKEAEVVLKEMGCDVYSSYDVGIAGFHRLFQPLHESLRREVDVFIVVAGMEGALPSVVASLVDRPVLGVPTSAGYGYGGGGKGALMSMLQSCSLGLAVVNIDNGAGAGALAALIANRVAEVRKA
jgi:NCAIR mutase (PurE)-related protein